MKPKVITNEGFTVDLSQIKSIQQSYSNGADKNTVTIEFKTRYDYIQHPGTGKFIKQKYSETSKREFGGFEEAAMFVVELRKIWEEYLNTQN